LVHLGESGSDLYFGKAEEIDNHDMARSAGKVAAVEIGADVLVETLDSSQSEICCLLGSDDEARAVEFDAWATKVFVGPKGCCAFLYSHGVGNWGWAIIILTVAFNLLTVWPRVLSTKSSLKMMRVQPNVDAIKKRYAHLALSDPQRADMNVETMALYKAEGASMFGGCLPFVLQMPLLFGYMRVLRSAPEVHQAHWYWLKDLSSPDPLHILPLLIIASSIVTQFVTPTPTMTSSQRWMLGLLMSAVMGFSLWHYASGLSLYWITGNIVSLAIQLAINQSPIGKEIYNLATERSGPNSG
jgi:YidC/Oxa1 family membrane protein insertase